MDFDWTLNNSSYRIKGKIDALFYSADHQPILLDYKTSRRLSTAADFEHYRSLQLPIYGLSLSKSIGSIPIGSLLFQMHHPDHTALAVIACTKPAKKDVFELKRKRPYLYDSNYFYALETHLLNLD